MSLFYDPFFDLSDHLRQFNRMQRDMDRMISRAGFVPATSSSQQPKSEAAAAAPAASADQERTTTMMAKPAEPVMNWFPVVDIKETDNAVVLHAELPGLRKEDINIHVDKGVLHVSGKREFEKKEENEKWHRVERSYGSFHRSFRLPENVKESDIAANCENGVLTVTVPKEKKQEPAVRRIAVQ